MWKRLWPDESFIHPADANEIDFIEGCGFPQWFVTGVMDDLKLAKQMNYLHVGTTASASLTWKSVEAQVDIVWPGLIDGQGRIARDTRDLRLYWCDGRLYIGFENGPEPVLLWEWK